MSAHESAQGADDSRAEENLIFPHDSDPSPYRKGHRPVPLDWVCTHHQDRACLACWFVKETLRLEREKQGIVDVPIPPPAPDPSVESVLPTGTGVSVSLAEQISQIYDTPLPERLPEE